MKRPKWQPEEKALIVFEGLKGRPIGELRAEHEISQAQYYHWRDQFLANAAKAIVYDADAFWSAGNPTRLTVPAGFSKVRLAQRATSTGPSAVQATATSGCTRTAPCSSAPAKEADAGDSGGATRRP